MIKLCDEINDLRKLMSNLDKNHIPEIFSRHIGTWKGDILQLLKRLKASFQSHTIKHYCLKSYF